MRSNYLARQALCSPEPEERALMDVTKDNSYLKYINHLSTQNKIIQPSGSYLQPANDRRPTRAQNVEYLSKLLLS